MMGRWLISALCVLLIVIAGCSQATIKAQPLNNTVPQPLDSCESMNCGDNAYCEAGVCMCSGGFKKCGNKCIAERSCCDNSQCPSGKVCQSGVCAERPLCGFNEQWDSASKQCFCAEGAKFCEGQGKCIPADACCTYGDCKYRDQRCAALTYSGKVCMSYGTVKCSVVHEGVPSRFMTSIGDFDVLLKNVLEGPRFDLQVNNDSIRRVEINESNTVANGAARIYVESMTVFGGYCRDEPD